MNRSIIWGLAGLAFVVAGCSGNSTNGAFNQPGPRTRAIDAMDGQPTLNWQVTGQGNLNFPTMSYGQLSNTFGTPYVILNERGNRTVEFSNTSNPPSIVAYWPPLQNGVVQTHGFTYGDKNTAIAYGATGVTAGVVFLYDQTADSTNGPNVRIVNAAQQQGAVDVFITPSGSQQSGSPTATLAPGAIYPAQSSSTFAYVALQTGQSYTLNVYPQGHDTGNPLVTDQLSMLAGTDVWTLVVIDPANSGGSPTILPVEDNNANAG